MAEKLRLQRIRSYYPLAGPGPFISNASDFDSTQEATVRNSRRPYTGVFQVAAAKRHERKGTHLLKRVSTAVDCTQSRSRLTETPMDMTLETNRMAANDDRQIENDPLCKSPSKKSTVDVAEDCGDANTDETLAIVEPEIARPKRTITVVLPSLKMTDDDDSVVGTDTSKRHALVNDAKRESLVRNEATTQQNLTVGQSKNDQWSAAALSSNDRSREDNADQKRSTVPVYKIKYVHFDKNRAAAGHARQIVNRLYAINIGSEAFKHSKAY